jgi:uncharacterized protein (TIGR02246 family)
MTDEDEIGRVIAPWQRATAEGDMDTILGLMADDAVFLAPGRPPRAIDITDFVRFR